MNIVEVAPSITNWSIKLKRVTLKTLDQHIHACSDGET